MKPRVIMHNSISIDGSVTGFDIDIAAHYAVAATYRPDAHLIGWITAKTGIETYMSDVPREEAEDHKKPAKAFEKGLPYFVISDSLGKLHSLLHVFRKFEHCRDVIVMISRTTSDNYIDYLHSRNYDYIVAGEKRIDYAQALEELNRRFEVETVLTDTGPTLNGALLEHGLVDEISLVVQPWLAMKGNPRLFEELDLRSNAKLRLQKSEALEGSLVHLHYSIEA